jgi:prepilin-type N-terminal cleavage/methylation domain-containing protein
MNRPNKGFTLMELLIVIGVLGILAAGLLAAIDPFEQLKKARDTNNRSAALELLGASQRYYATHGYLPWYKQTVTGVFDCDGNPADAEVVGLRDAPPTTGPWNTVPVNKEGSTNHNTAMKTCVDSTLGVDGEIKSTFFDGLATTLYVTSGSATRVSVCFPPEGKSNRSDAQTAYNTTSAGVITTGCTTVQRDLGECVQCFQ